MNSEMPVWAEKMITFDTETTGVSTRESRIVSAAIILINGAGEAEERYDWLLDPEIDIPAASTSVHGITTEMARQQGMQAAVGIAQISDKISEFIKTGYPLVVYNAPYDLSLLGAEAKRHNAAVVDNVRPVLDPLVIDKQLDRYRRGKRTLVAVSEHYGVTLNDAHDAGADAMAAAQVMQKIAQKYKAKLPSDIEELHDLQVQWAREQAESFQAFMRKSKDPSFVADGSWPLKV